MNLYAVDYTLTVRTAVYRFCEPSFGRVTGSRFGCTALEASEFCTVYTVRYVVLETAVSSQPACF